MRNEWLFAVVVHLTMTTGSLADEVNVALHHHPTLLKMLQTNNELRDGVGLAAQRISPELTKAAQDHALYMARTGNFIRSINSTDFTVLSKYSLEILQPSPINEPKINAMYIFFETFGLTGFFDIDAWRMAVSKNSRKTSFTLVWFHRQRSSNFGAKFEKKPTTQ